MAGSRRRSKRKPAVTQPELDAPARARAERAEESIKTAREHVAVMDAKRADALRRGDEAKPHKQVETERGVLPSDHRLEDAHVVDLPTVPLSQRPLQDVGQESLGMGPLRRRTAQQPPGRSHVAHTVPTTTDEFGRPLVFFSPAQGSAPTGQAAKASGGTQQYSGGLGGSVILSDVRTEGDPLLPVFADRVLTDADMPGSGSRVVPSGASNGPRLHMETESLSGRSQAMASNPPRGAGLVRSDRNLEPGETVEQAQADNNQRDTPASGGGEELGMGPTKFSSGNLASPARLRKAEDEGAPVTVQTTTAPGEPKAKPKAKSRSRSRAKGRSKVELETKEVRSAPNTEQKDAKVVTGTSSGKEAAPPPAPPETKREGE